jgi:hypothetical protein
VDLKETGLAEQSGMIVLRERHKGLTWKAADSITDSLFKLLDPGACGRILMPQFKDYFLHRLHPDLERHSTSPVRHSRSSSRVGSSSGRKGPALNFNNILQGARLKYQQREAARRSRGGGGGCFVAGTEVLTPLGVQVAIDLLRLGDEVLAFDSAGAVQPATVRGCMSFLSDQQFVVALSNGRVMQITGQHPVCVGPNIFCRADSLVAGQRVMVRGSRDDSLSEAFVSHVDAVSCSTVVYNLSTTPFHTFFAADVAVHNKGGGGGCFSRHVPVTLVLRNSGGHQRVCISQLSPGDVIEGAQLQRLCMATVTSRAGGGRVLAVMSFLRSEAAPLYRYKGTQFLYVIESMRKDSSHSSHSHSSVSTCQLSL